MRAAIIDDLALCREELKENLTRYFSENYIGEEPVVEEFASGSEFMKMFQPEHYDVIFIDQYMEGLSGIDTAREIRRRDTSVALIFVTTSCGHAVDSYGVRACGYLVKPYSYEAFEQTMKLARVEKILKARFICVGDDKILLRDIVWCDRDGHYIQIHTDSCGVMRYRMAFSALETALASYPQFLQCYRGLMVNMDRAERIEEMEFFMDTGERVPFRKRDQADLRKRFSHYMFQKEREGGLF